MLFSSLQLRRNVIDVSFHISQYQTIIQELAGEIASLKEQRSDLESRISHLDPRLNVINGEDKSKLEEALKLRESLLQSFKHQIGLRKAILELDNAIMDINIEADRNAKIIEAWELHKESSTLSKQTAKISEYTAGSITNIREELKVVESDREDLEIKRKAAIRDLESSKIKTKRLRDIAAKKLNSNEQKEILTLLVKNFEFELRNIEMQADIFKRDFKLREQDMVILRLEQHRSLCDTLIFQQRQLITDNNIQIPKDLDELYALYSRDINEGQLMKDLTRIDFKNSSPSLNNSNANGNSQLASSSFLTNNKDLNSSFLSQIQEDDSEHATNGNNNAIVGSINKGTRRKNSYERSLDMESEIVPTAANANAFTFPDIVENNSSKIFEKSNKLAQANSSSYNNVGPKNVLHSKKNVQSNQKEANYQNVNNFTNGNNGLSSGKHYLKIKM